MLSPGREAPAHVALRDVMPNQEFAGIGAVAGVSRFALWGRHPLYSTFVWRFVQPNANGHVLTLIIKQIFRAIRNVLCDGPTYNVTMRPDGKLWIMLWFLVVLCTFSCAMDPSTVDNATDHSRN